MFKHSNNCFPGGRVHEKTPKIFSNSPCEFVRTMVLVWLRSSCLNIPIIASRGEGFAKIQRKYVPVRERYAYLHKRNTQTYA